MRNGNTVALFPNRLPHDKLSKIGNTGNGNPPGGGDLETRIINLERDLTDIKVAVGKIETRLEGIDKNMLTKGQMAIYMLLAGATMLGAGWWVVQQYLAPILARAL